ncbi:hypothetical protein VCRA2116O30_90170 [Vibrio crassostreae]|uniref:Integrase-like protein n=1 Tax=Vibrio crassostreae TaxID=246167 RepID=A0ABM9QNE0_9VIBR|nr:hypothetical protein VCRA2117O37_100161 [Vibrio crassostreae]CAK1710232.1 hypothetical protein VCRA2116O31_100169 [Vibrio crassostreae]CAK1929526.1 hypothetical protein VCRA2110O1_270010 [Vibrio crassostreae]CAK1937448.1 hypothetical protein VCRA2110O4_270010 [Vibrio crassostreae]CAK1942901.1 hypothetical protein VCRA2114E5_260010 [Vibrio crassostreae]
MRVTGKRDAKRLRAEEQIRDSSERDAKGLRAGVTRKAVYNNQSTKEQYDIVRKNIREPVFH